MAHYLSLLSLLLITALTFISATTPPTSSPPPSPSNTPPPPPQLQQQQLNKIIDALIGSGDFSNWANLISAADPLILPFNATFFIPGDDAFSHFSTTPPIIIFDPFIFPYHILPHRLSFSDLLLFKLDSRLPTLLPNNSILITNNSRSNFTLDHSPITHPDLYITDSLSVHGIRFLLDYSVYGPALSPPPPPPMMVMGEIVGHESSDAVCLCTDFIAIVVSVVCVAFKLLQR